MDPNERASLDPQRTGWLREHCVSRRSGFVQWRTEFVRTSLSLESTHKPTVLQSVHSVARVGRLDQRVSVQESGLIPKRRIADARTPNSRCATRLKTGGTSAIPGRKKAEIPNRPLDFRRTFVSIRAYLKHIADQAPWKRKRAAGLIPAASRRLERAVGSSPLPNRAARRVSHGPFFYGPNQTRKPRRRSRSRTASTPIERVAP
jgi:hypothetical protein